MTAYTASNPVPMTALPTTSGVVQQFLVGTTNTGSSTFAPDGLAAAPIFGLGGAQLQGGEIVTDGIATLVSYVGTLLNSGSLCWVLFSCTGGAEQVGTGTGSQQAATVGQIQKGSLVGAAAAGTANALTATIASTLTSLTDGQPLTIIAASANTAATTLALTLGTTTLSTLSIVKGNNQALNAGDIPAAGYPIELNYSATFGAYVMQNPATWLSIAALATNTGPIADQGAALVGFDGGTLQTQLESKINRVVDSIASLRTLSSTTYTRAFVTGYYSPSDGGGGPYQFNPDDTTSSDNGGTIIVAADGGRWALQSTSIISVKQFGATGNGSTDDTASMQAAHNLGVPIYYPQGTYAFSTLTIGEGGIVGESSGTVLSSSDTSGNNVITCTLANAGSLTAPIFSNFVITAQNAKSGGAGLAFVPSEGGYLTYLKVDQVGVYNMPTGISFTSCLYGSCTNCNVINYTSAGIYYSNTNNPEAGDFYIGFNVFNTAESSGNRIAFYQASGGGIRFEGNKILGGVSGVTLEYGGSSQSGPMLITGNSIENCSAFGIYLGTTGTAHFGGIVISGNEIAETPTCISSDINGLITLLTITGNFLSPTGTTGTGVLLNTVSDFLISGNLISGQGSSSTGIYLTPGNTLGKIQGNTFLSLGTPINNNSPSCVAVPDIQTGTASATTSTPYGSFYLGSYTVTFPRPFLTTPVCTGNVTSTSDGGISLLCTGASNTTCTFVVAGINDSANVPFTWQAAGLI